MKKFLKVCWKKDPDSGESNHNIDEDFGIDTLFHNPKTSNKKEKIKNSLTEKILKGEITNNVQGLEYTLKNGCQPKLFIEVVKTLKNSGKITLEGNISDKASNIHKIKKPFYIKLFN